MCEWPFLVPTTDAGHSRRSLGLVACNDFRPDGAQEKETRAARK
jgi:hypothetical protein